MTISYQRKKRIEKSISNAESSGKPQLLVHMPEVVSTRRRCAYYSAKEREKKMSMICNFCYVGLCVKNCFCCIINTTCISNEMNKCFSNYNSNFFY